MISRRRRAQKSVPVIEPPDARKAKNLPMFGPGIVIHIPLHLWPAYQALYQLEPNGYAEATGTLLVKRSKEKI